MPRGGNTSEYAKGLERRAKAAEFDDLKARNDQQKARLGVHVDFLIEKDLLDDFVKWEQSKKESTEA